MRRDEKQITDRSEIDAVICRSTACRLGMSDGDQPYVIPLCFGYDGSALYFHCAPEGRKLDILRENPKVCVEFDVAGDVVEAEVACSWGIRFQCVVAFGTALLVGEPDEKKKGLALLMAQYSRSGKEFSFPDASVSRTAIIKVVIDKITGNQSIRQQLPARDK
jgi:nitroimidazol reductase NimA-like FMN-containing flavoprotein (pyridoxamine 5'-phosphate oxidase superfamily)